MGPLDPWILKAFAAEKPSGDEQIRTRGVVLEARLSMLKGSAQRLISGGPRRRLCKTLGPA